MLRSWVRRQQKRFERGEGPTFRTYTWGTGGSSARPETKKEGEVTYERVSRTERKISSEIGDYVEFEEVEVTGTEVDADTERE